jgi:hypothetical protein
MLVRKKWATTEEDFQRRKERAIELIKNKTYEMTPRNKVFISEHELRTEYLFQDIDKVYDKFDHWFFNGDYILLIDEKTVMV